MNERKPEFPVHDLFLKRWSPRALSGEPIAYEVLMGLFEAAKWAPSSRNAQPWHFIYAESGSDRWSTFFNFLTEKNQAWAKNGSVLVVVLSYRLVGNTQEVSKSHSFDTGSACQNFALQALLSGVTVRTIGGFNRELVKQELAIPDAYAVEVMLVLGKQADSSSLPEQFQEHEKPSGRKSIQEFVCKDFFAPR